MKDDAIIVLDPVNQNVISEGLKKGIKTFVGGNCTRKQCLWLSAVYLKKIWWNGFLWQLIKRLPVLDPKNMRELLSQMGLLEQAVSSELKTLLHLF